MAHGIIGRELDGGAEVLERVIEKSLAGQVGALRESGHRDVGAGQGRSAERALGFSIVEGGERRSGEGEEVRI
jgi:hypothetical protein